MSGLPTVDGDGMGRAFPMVHHVSWFMKGLPCSPAVMADVDGLPQFFEVKDCHDLEVKMRDAGIL